MLTDTLTLAQLVGLEIITNYTSLIMKTDKNMKKKSRNFFPGMYFQINKSPMDYNATVQFIIMSR